MEDKERDLSAQFIDMDEQFFTPTMAKYQQQLRQSPKSDTSRKNTRPASMFNKSSTKPSSLESKLVRKNSFERGSIIHFAITGECALSRR